MTLIAGTTARTIPSSPPARHDGPRQRLEPVLVTFVTMVTPVTAWHPDNTASIA